MKRLRFNLMVAALVLGLLAFARFGSHPVTVRFHPEVSEFRELAESLRIRNMVSAVYLGPRVLDTFLEALVVVLAVTGMAFVRQRP
ncbi:MAG: hypothetical protein U1E27_12390 [Kiritimatiellia bacterium]|nr:hypothetical protein [Kiritimatiellia bacterium]